MEERVIRTHECFSRGPRQGLCPAIYHPKSHCDSARKPRANSRLTTDKNQSGEITQKTHSLDSSPVFAHCVSAHKQSIRAANYSHAPPGPCSFFFFFIHITTLVGRSTPRVTTPPHRVEANCFRNNRVAAPIAS